MAGSNHPGFLWLDADGYLCNGPYTRPDGDGNPKRPTRLERLSCRTCRHCGLDGGGALLCRRPVEVEHDVVRPGNFPILEAMELFCADRRYWKHRTPPGRLDLRQLELPILAGDE